MAKFTTLVGAPAPFDPASTLVTSPVFSPMVLAVLRLIFGLTLLAGLLVNLIHRAVVDHTAQQFFSYFTMLTGIGLMSYLFHCGWMGAVYAARVRRRPATASYPLQSWPRTLQVLHMILLASVRTLPLLVSIVFWIFLAGGDTLKSVYGRYTNITLHALNTVFALFEVFLTHTPVSAWFNLIFMVLILGGYLGVAYITHATQGFYTYGFLDPSHGAGKLAAYIVGIPVTEIIFFSLVNGLVALRVKIAPKPAAPRHVGGGGGDVEKGEHESLKKSQN
ncbi:hypothetical protein BKA62DRAFT_638929 [Auriculariales sp. MPI-PUGE-AT-0066]|nr:hypothetical protein BKA62DRAFT_638929 [Auriculariales sp. MPI-PUGE-AT-0066]